MFNIKKWITNKIVTKVSNKAILEINETFNGVIERVKTNTLTQEDKDMIVPFIITVQLFMTETVKTFKEKE